MANVLVHRGKEGIGDFIYSVLPQGNFHRIVLKPNWVKHQELAEFPIEALVTSAEIIDLTIEACRAKYPHAERITIGDVPLQTCDWELLCKQSGIDKLKTKYKHSHNPVVSFEDWRRERWELNKGFMRLVSDAPGDLRGYVDVTIDEQSMLEEISDNSKNFRVSDYDPQETVSHHKKGRHHYLISKTVLEADLVINLPKMKTHQKAGMTGALKNLVGINGSKAFLVHHQKSRPGSLGDEFPPETSKLFYYQARLRELLQKRSRFLFKIGKFGWELIKKVRGIETIGTRHKLSGNFYIGSGSWHGNDSIWRMVYDLNLILLLASSIDGKLQSTPQRTILCLMDGLVAGEGNGPLQPLPVKADVLIASNNPFLLDFCAVRLMRFDWKKIRMLSNYKRFGFKEWSEFDPDNFPISESGDTNKENWISQVTGFLAPPGWINNIELKDKQ